MRRPVLSKGIEGACRGQGKNADILTVVINPNHAVVPACPHILPQQSVRYRVEGSGHLYIAVGMHTAGAYLEEIEAFRSHRLERWFFHLQEMGIHLLTGRSVDAQYGYSAIPALKESVQFLQTVKAPPFKSVILNIASAPLGNVLLLGMAGARW